jgi:osmotically inducible protein OsmC
MAMAAIREATAIWQGDLKSGSGRTSAESSRAFRDLELSWRARAERPDGGTSPEELLAAAHAGCFSMALSARLAQMGHAPESLFVRCRVSFDPVALKVERSRLEVSGRVPGLEPTAFAQAAEEAKENCPISRALRGNVILEVRATASEAELQPPA